MDFSRRWEKSRKVETVQKHQCFPKPTGPPIPRFSSFLAEPRKSGTAKGWGPSGTKGGLSVLALMRTAAFCSGGATMMLLCRSDLMPSRSRGHKVILGPTAHFYGKVLYS